MQKFTAAGPAEHAPTPEFLIPPKGMLLSGAVPRFSFIMPRRLSARKRRPREFELEHSAEVRPNSVPFSSSTA